MLRSDDGLAALVLLDGHSGLRLVFHLYRNVAVRHDEDIFAVALVGNLYFVAVFVGNGDFLNALVIVGSDGEVHLVAGIGMLRSDDGLAALVFVDGHSGLRLVFNLDRNVAVRHDEDIFAVALVGNVYFVAVFVGNGDILNTLVFFGRNGYLHLVAGVGMFGLHLGLAALVFVDGHSGLRLVFDNDLHVALRHGEFIFAVALVGNVYNVAFLVSNGDFLNAAVLAGFDGYLHTVAALRIRGFDSRFAVAALFELGLVFDHVGLARFEMIATDPFAVAPVKPLPPVGRRSYNIPFAVIVS